MSFPSFTCLASCSGSQSWRELRVEFGTLSPEWEAKRQQMTGGNTTAGNPWCHFVLWFDNQGKIDPVLGAFGGNVNPEAWPEYFAIVQGKTRLTDLGLYSVRRAFDEYDRNVEPGRRFYDFAHERGVTHVQDERTLFCEYGARR